MCWELWNFVERAIVLREMEMVEYLWVKVSVLVIPSYELCWEEREIVVLVFSFFRCVILESQSGVSFVRGEREKWGQTSLSKLVSWPSEISVWLYSLSGSEILEVQFDCREFWLAANSGRSLSRRGRRVRFCARGMESCSWQRSTAWSAAHPALYCVCSWFWSQLVCLLLRDTSDCSVIILDIFNKF